MRGAIFSMVLLVGLALARPALPPQSSEYVGMETCRSCHGEIYKTYQNVGMAKTFKRIDAVPLIEDWTKNNRFFHKPSNQYFEMTRQDGRFFQRRYQQDPSGRRRNEFEQEIHYIFGSGNKERDYVHVSEAGEMIQFPVAWYSGENKWGMAPGYDRADHDGFTRSINYRCFSCHNAYPKTPVGADRHESKLSIYPRDLPQGIDCERCHGPGKTHAQSGGLIVNPAKLSRKLQMDVCMQCHLETTGFALPNSVLKDGRAVFSYRPGEPLEDYAVYFDFPKGAGHDNDFNIVHQAYRLRKSECFAKSEMTCTTCHDPHRRPESPLSFNSKCESCHVSGSSSNVCVLPLSRRRSNGNNCAACHMPQRRTYDAVHDIMTDHFIQRRPAGNLLAPRQDPNFKPYRGDLAFYLPEPNRDLYLGLGLVRGADVARGVGLLERALGLSADGSMQLGLSYQTLGKRDLAIQSYRQALAKDPDYAEASYNLGLVLLQSGRVEEATAALEQAILKQPAMADAYVALASSKAQIGDWELVRKYNLEALRIRPTHVLAMYNLSILERQSGRVDRANAYIEQILKVDPTALSRLGK